MSWSYVKIVLPYNWFATNITTYILNETTSFDKLISFNRTINAV